MIDLRLGDCFEVMNKLPSRSVDMVFADPPYGMTDLAWDNAFPMDKLWPELERIGKPNAAYVFTASQPFTSLLICSKLQWFRTEWIWKKNAGSNFATVKWHPMKEHESVVVFGSGVTTYNPIKQPRSKPIKEGYTNHSNTGKRLAYSGVTHNKGFTVEDGEMRCPSSVQLFNRERGLHPNQKPVDMVEYFVRTYSNEGDIVLDPFMGSGTTGMACVNSKRNFFGIELNAGYFETAKKRIPQGEPQGIHSMRKAGMSLPEIAREAHLSVPEVARILRG